MFVFSCYAGGLRISDTLLLKWSNVRDGRINISMRKTGEQLAFKLPTVAVDIVSKYADQKSERQYVFPALRLKNENNPRELDSAISSANAKINKALKQIATDAGITKNLSFHIARHTFATMALRLGIGIEYVSKILGHSAIKETQIYAKIVNSSIDNAMDVFNR